MKFKRGDIVMTKDFDCLYLIIGYKKPYYLGVIHYFDYTNNEGRIIRFTRDELIKIGELMEDKK